MKTKLFFIAFVLTTLTANSQLLQKNFGTPQKHFVNANLASVNDGSNDIIIATNLFDTNAPATEPTLKRVDENGAVVWIKTYENTSLQNARLFDIENYFDLIFVTGSIDVSGTKRLFVAKIEALSGNVLDAKFYDVVSPNFNSMGLKIMATNSDANNDGVVDPGFVITGYFSSCYTVDLNCSLNAGLVLRTDLNLNLLWSKELESIIPGGSAQDYDFINGVVETNDGFLLTGSVTGQDTFIQQAVLAHKFDFEGNFVWDSSYIFGNARDLSVDAYYDPATNEVFMLNNYSNAHHFGVTVLDNATGAINFSKSWYVNEVNFELDFYGFSLLESDANPNNLIVMGYRRDYFNGSSMDQSNAIIYEFEKATGNQVNLSYQYLLPFQEPVGDEYNFWNAQMPLMYYPDMAMNHTASSGVASYYAVGYREVDPAAGGFTNIELFRMNTLNRNVCDNLVLNFTTNPIASVTALTTVSSGNTPVISTALALNFVVPNYTDGSCDPTMSLEDNTSLNIKMYPNPTTDYVFINARDIEQIEVYDVTGKRLLVANSYNSNRGIYIGDFKNGMYLLTIKTQNSTVQTCKLIKK